MAVLFLVSSAVATSSSSNTAKVKDDGLPPIEQLQASLKREPGNAKLYVQLGQAYWAAGDYQNAFEALKQGVKLAPSSAAAHNWMGAFLMGRGGLWMEVLSPEKALRMAYDHNMVEPGTPIEEGGEVAFFPPVTGG